jgi:hypothetical protein
MWRFFFRTLVCFPTKVQEIVTYLAVFLRHMAASDTPSSEHGCRYSESGGPIPDSAIQGCRVLLKALELARLPFEQQFHLPRSVLDWRLM